MMKIKTQLLRRTTNTQLILKSLTKISHRFVLLQAMTNKAKNKQIKDSCLKNCNKEKQNF